MKRLFLILISVLVSLQSYGGSVYDFSGLYGTEERIRSQIEEWERLFGQAMNGQIGEMMNVSFLQFGAEISFIPFDHTGVLANSKKNHLVLLTQQMGLSLYGFTLFTRVMIPTSESSSGPTPPFIAGGGLAYNLDVTLAGGLPLLALKPSFSYHNLISFKHIISAGSYGLHLQSRLILGSVQPFINAGLSFTVYETDVVPWGSSVFFQDTKVLFHAAVGIRVWALFYQMDFSPGESHSFGLALRF